jgi:glutaredoxin
MASPAIFAGDIYKWEDENGVMHYTDTAPSDESEWVLEETSSIDGQDNSSSPLRNYDPDMVSEILDEIKDDDEPTEEESLCKYCQKAKAFFNSRGIKFVEYNIEEDQKAAERLSSLTESDSVPFAVINGQHIKGYSASAYVRAMRN